MRVKRTLYSFGGLKLGGWKNLHTDGKSGGVDGIYVVILEKTMFLRVEVLVPGELF